MLPRIGFIPFLVMAAVVVSCDEGPVWIEPEPVWPDTSCTLAALETTAAGALTPTDCRDDGGFYADFFTVTAADSAPVLVLAATSSDSLAYRPSLTLHDARGRELGSGDVAAGTSVLRVAAAPGESYVVRVSAAAPDQVGSYTLEASARPVVENEGCVPFWIVRGTVLDAEITGDDCRRVGGYEGNRVWYSDEYRIMLEAGDTVALALTASFPGVELWFYGGSGGPPCCQSQVTYVAARDGSHRARAGPSSFFTTGTYVLTVR